MGESELTWRRLLAVRSAELYAVTDIDRVRRVGGIFWICGALLAAVILPFAPPDESSLGGAGWIVAGAIVLVAAACGLAMFRGAVIFRPGWKVILAAGYAGIVTTTILNWLAGPDAPYSELLLIGAIRLSRPGAPWARWRYEQDSRRMLRALRRERRLRRPLIRAKIAVQDLMAGRIDYFCLSV